MDGIKLMIECSGDDDKQNCHYNEWTCGHYSNSVLVFCTNGTISICCYSIPGTVPDSMVAFVGSIYEKLEYIFNSCGACCIVNLALACNTYPFPLNL